MNTKTIKTLKRLAPLGLILVVGFLNTGCGTKIPSGHKGVLYRTFGDGTEMGKIYAEGFNWHFPWNTYFIYRTQQAESKENLQVLSSDGATIGLDVSLLFRPEPTKLDSLQVTVGANYYNDVVAPNLRGVARSIVGLYKPEEIYATKRDQIAAEIENALRTELDKKWVIVERVIIRDVTIPKRITEAINAKLEALQEAEKMEFILQREKQEAERKRIEAQGIADFQKIVSSGLTAEFLRWKGIEATQKLAESPNAKTVVIGGGKDGLPLILGGGN